ncbi:hypothetical protein [Sphingobacterium griseoflavum]|uniref:Transcriptional regulator n=1 Tax=Sphingobacterium griseoflavum TaxID=1474952 RepID=A0ABQ3HWI1_9SPHI|nr:hypothetical protein [Sphingobacterium griseoflavum]GHE34667.1 hypothetical protein GCM10017764_17260 [Sphingobacterium griseoflavum]
MIAVITGDIVKSRSREPEVWLPILEKAIAIYAKDYDVFRGDSFQLEVSLAQALTAAFYIKAAMIEVGLDVRLGIGIGNKDDNSPHIKTTFGSALVYSGEAFDELKKDTLYLKSSSEAFNELCNTILPLLTELCVRWTPNIAETVKVALQHEGVNQVELAKILNKKYQSQVSTALQKAGFSKMQHALAYCTQQLLTL